MNKQQYIALQRQLSEQTNDDMGKRTMYFPPLNFCSEPVLDHRELYDGIIASPKYAGGVLTLPSENQVKEFGK